MILHKKIVFSDFDRQSGIPIKRKALFPEQRLSEGIINNYLRALRIYRVAARFSDRLFTFRFAYSAEHFIFTAVCAELEFSAT